MRRIKTIDAEVAGEAVRLVVAGGPSVSGRTMAEKLAWLRRHGEDLRRLLMLEPRGHAGMHGALFTEPVTPDARAGVLSMHASGFPVVSGEAIIAAVTLAIENGIMQGEVDDLPIDTAAGLMRVRPAYDDDPAHEPGASRVSSVTLTGVPSFVRAAGLSLRIGNRKVAVDVAFGGEFYAIADSEAVGIPVEIANGPALIRMGREIKEAVESTVHISHPSDSRLQGIQGTIFTGAPRAAADLRSATVLDGEVLRRSPGATGTAALVAVIDAMGLLGEEQRFRHEGILGTVLQARVVGRKQIDEIEAVTPLVEGSARVTGYHEFVDW